jgi:hypothetical protein
MTLIIDLYTDKFQEYDPVAILDCYQGLYCSFDCKLFFLGVEIDLQPSDYYIQAGQYIYSLNGG